MTTPPLDLITDDDLPSLRAVLLEHADNTVFSDTFRTMCLRTVDAIDDAVADGAAINARLQLALESWKLAADTEVASC